MLKYVKENLLDFYFANRREQFVLPAPWCASFRHEGNYNGGDAAAGLPCIGRENGRVDLISDAAIGGLWYTKPDDAGNVIEIHEHVGEFKEA